MRPTGRRRRLRIRDEGRQRGDGCCASVDSLTLHFAGTTVQRSGVIHDPIIAVALELRAADKHNQVIGSALAWLMEIQQVAWVQSPGVASDLTRVQSDQRLRVGELRIPGRQCAGDAKQRPALTRRTRGAADVGKLRSEGQLRRADPLRRVRAQRFTKRMPDQRRAVDHIRGLALELRVGQEDEPGAEGGAIGFVRETHLRRQGSAGGPQREHGGKNGASMTHVTTSRRTPTIARPPSARAACRGAPG